jgi:hypothetical protein
LKNLYEKQKKKLNLITATHKIREIKIILMAELENKMIRRLEVSFTIIITILLITNISRFKLKKYDG